VLHFLLVFLAATVIVSAALVRSTMTMKRMDQQVEQEEQLEIPQGTSNMK
jgi:hypothetical protein